MPLFWLSLAWLVGILAGSQAGGPWAFWPGLGLVCLALTLALRRFAPAFTLTRRLAMAGGRLALPPLVLLAVCLGGVARYQAGHPPLSPNDIAWYGGRGPLKISGQLTAPPANRDNGSLLRINVSRITSLEDSQDRADRPVKGMILVTALPGGSWQYGDQVELTGEVESLLAPGQDSYEDYLWRQGIQARLTFPQITVLKHSTGSPFLAALYAFKARALGVLERIFPAPESDLLAGILLGDDSGISAPLQEAFRRTGTAHIIAISGFNISILAGLFTILGVRLLGRWKGALAAALAIGFYALLVGPGASIWRAALMGWIGLLGQQFGRRQEGLNTLAFTAALMALYDSNYLWDAGFQLSFAATLGLVLYAGALQDGFQRLLARWLQPSLAQRLAGIAGAYLLFTLAAQLTTLPIMMVQFKQVSLLALLANPLVLPVQPAVMILSGLALIGGLIHPLLGQGLAYLAWPFTAYTIRAVEWLATLPWGVFDLGEISLVFVALVYAVLFGLTLSGTAWLRSPAAFFRSLLTPQVTLTVFGVGAILTWTAVLSIPDGRLHLTVLEAGPPVSLLIETPGGRFLLINGSPPVDQVNQAIGQRLPLFNRRLEGVLETSADPAGLRALPQILASFLANRVWWALPGTIKNADFNTSQYLEDKRMMVEPMVPGQRLALGRGAGLEVLQTSEANASISLEYGGFRALIWASSQAGAALPAALADGRPYTMLILDASDLGSSALPSLVTTSRPQVVLLSVAAGNRSGPPSAETLKAVQGYTLLRTDQNGWIEVSTDGERMWVEVEKK